MALVAAASAGCAAPEPPHRDEPVRPRPRGYIVMLPGIEGGARMFRGSIAGLREAGIDDRIDVIEWGSPPFTAMKNLTDLEANLRHAQHIAERIAEHQRDAPDDPITLIGYSGGGGLAILVAEALPPGVMLERIILIAAAIAPDHDLSAAVRHCRCGLVNDYSARDTVVLGAGTRVFGTIDRKKVDSAGYVGFTDGDGKLLESERIAQVAWRPDWSKLGHDGGHIGWQARAWAREVLARQIAP